MPRNIHIYNRGDSGALAHTIQYGEDLGGPIGVSGETVPLRGWPTPAMRQGVSGDGREGAWYVGTDERGQIVRT